VTKNDNGKTWKAMLEVWLSLGYHIEWAILDAKDYNHPQLRSRLFLIGFREDVYKTPYKFPEKMDKAIDDIMKQYSDLQNSGIVKLIDFIYDPKIGLQVAYNGSVYGLCGVIGGIGYDIMNHPDKLDKFKSFYNSYSDTVKKLASARCKTMTAAIAACATNNIESNSIKKDQLWPIYNTEDISKNVREFNDDTIEQFSSYFKGMKNDDDLKNNTEAIKALETIADIIKHVNSDILAYMSAIVDIITKLEDIFGYEKMWSHTDEKAWKSVREVHKS
jgi:site-specific DNA-cytosine methylase